MARPRPASFARRALPAVAIAGVSGGVLLQLDQPRTSALSSAATPRTSIGAASAASAATAVTTVPPSTAAAATSPTTASGSVGRTSVVTASPPTTALATTPATAAVSDSCSGAPLDGPTVDTRWGPVQVAAVFTAAGRLCEVQTLVSPSDHRKSVQINQYALPVLHREALAAGSAAIDIVSGATVTSDAYATSLQAIIDTRR